MQAIKITTEQPELNERFNRCLADTIRALDASGIRYAFIGGIASGGQGRPRSTHDIDVFVRPEDAQLALRALEKLEFRTERTDPSWLYKGWKENILVDVIFKSKGEIYLDREMYDRTSMVEFHGMQLRMIAPEDLLIIKASAHSELTPGHWHDALALLSHATIDWDYLIRRAKRAPRKVLSLLIYATGSDLWVPKNVIDELYRFVFGEVPSGTGQVRAAAPSAVAPANDPPKPEAPKVETPKVEATKVETPKVETPKVEAPQSEPPKSTAPNASVAQPSHPQQQPPFAAQQAGHPGSKSSLRMVKQSTSQYAVAKIHEALAEDSRTHELDIQVETCEGCILLRGEVMTEERRQAAEAVVREIFPEVGVENQIRVSQVTEPKESEEIQ